MSGPDDSDQQPVGSLVEEAAKLLGALGGFGQACDGDATEAEGARSPWVDFSEHLATGGRECTYCPLCRVIGAVRGTSPEVKQHLATAASGLLQAANSLLEAATAHQGTNRSAEEPVEKIDVDEDVDWEDN
ncbi:hypothetical protein [Nocardioides mesophilus]|uniref:Uncharacterized protein n=1 Tax=Nocardioides mesophilus TaxID=433659 RepID=A0A7G9RC30_9ACTN|nr:hypothetical protein [Nocardioides mesophilus]QNN53155.1 hypothetical protein H9L09_01255 [Nocardioides mesophilus]